MDTKISAKVFDGVVCPLDIRGKETGPLAGKTFMAKDLLDVAGFVTGGGNPDWERTHGPALQTTPAIELLLHAGAHLIGKTCTDELAYSLDGINIHFGIPANPNLPGHIPGGSSSGSASVVAAGLCDFALGTDTAGSVRVPSAYCGLYGIRPTHGRIPLKGTIPLGPTFDTVGWMARSAQTLSLVGSILLGESQSLIVPLYADKKVKQGAKFFLLDTGWDLVDPEFKTLTESAIKLLTTTMGAYEKRSLSMETLQRCADLFDAIRSFEAWKFHGKWFEETNPNMDEVIKNRFLNCRTVTESKFHSALTDRTRMIDELAYFLKDGIFCVPCIRNWAPANTSTNEERAPNRQTNVLLNTLSSFGGFPQIVIPVKTKNGTSIPLSFITGRGKDSLLLSLAMELGPLSL